MAKKDEQQAPAAAGGLVRYFEEDDSLMKIDPKIAFGAIVGFSVLVLLLHLYSPRLIGA